MGLGRTDYPFVSVVIPTFKRCAYVKKTVESLLVQSYPKDRFEVIVVDGSSGDGTAETIGSLAASAEVSVKCLVKAPEGPASSRNFGAEAARGEVLAFIDSDCVAAEDWLAEGVRLVGGEVAVVQGRTLPDPSVPWTVFSRSIRIESMSGIYECCNIFYLKEAFLGVKGFSDAYRSLRFGDLYLGGEDLDLAYRVMRSGRRSVFAPGAVVYHEVTKKSLWSWFIEPQFLIWPLMVKRFPELRRGMFMRYFLTRSHFFLILLAGAVALGFYNKAFLLGATPYVVDCALKPSAFWKGIFNVFRFLVFIPRDLAAMALMLWGSIRYRSLLI